VSEHRAALTARTATIIPSAASQSAESLASIGDNYGRSRVVTPLGASHFCQPPVLATCTSSYPHDRSCEPGEKAGVMNGAAAHTEGLDELLSEQQRRYLAEVSAGRAVSIDDVAVPWKQDALRHAAVAGVIDPDDRRLNIPDGTREWLRDRTGKPTRWESDPSSRPSWWRGWERQRSEARRQCVATAIRRRADARCHSRGRPGSLRTGERRPRCRARRRPKASRAGPGDSEGEPPPSPSANASPPERPQP
jgi:hypothetical protein